MSAITIQTRAIELARKPVDSTDVTLPITIEAGEVLLRCSVEDLVALRAESRESFFRCLALLQSHRREYPEDTAGLESIARSIASILAPRPIGDPSINLDD